MFRIEDTISSQYANSPRLMLIIQELHNAIDPTKNIQDFYRIMWNLETAQGVGLDIWGRIVGIGRNVPLQNPEEESFGFHTDSPEPKFTPFNVAPFRTDSGGFNAYSLPDSLYRKLIFAKAFANIILATAPNINKLLKILLETPSVYLLTGIMQAKYQFQGRLSAFDRMIVFRLGLLPEPCGVAVEYEEVLQGFPLNGTILLNGTAQLGN